MCLAVNLGACDGEAVVLILDLLRQRMQLSRERLWDEKEALQEKIDNLKTINHQLRARNEDLTIKLRDKSMIEDATLRKKCDKIRELYHIAREKCDELTKTHQEEINELETKYQNEYTKLRKKMITKLDKSRHQTAELEKKLKQVTNNDTSVGLKEFHQYIFSEQADAMSTGVIDWNRSFAEHAFH